MILLLDCGSSKTKYIESIVYEICDVKRVPLLDFQEENLQEIQGIILSGAPLLVTEVTIDKYLIVMKRLVESRLPILGICFGHQLLGLHFGAEASRMKEDRDWQTVEIFEDCPLFQRLPHEILFLEDHCETISIPAGFQLVGSSDVCVNEAMQHTSLPLFGVQFHPEVSGNHGAILLENFANFCLRDVYP